MTKPETLPSKLLLVAFFNISVFMVQVSRGHNFSPATEKKNHRDPQGLKEKKLGVGSGEWSWSWHFLSLYWNYTANGPLQMYSRGLQSNNSKHNSLTLSFADFLLYQERYIPQSIYKKDVSP